MKDINIWVKNKWAFKIFLSLNIRKISLIQIKLVKIKEYENFIYCLKSIPSLREIEYSYHKKSRDMPDLRKVFKRIVTTNLTGAKSGCTMRF